MIFFSHIRRQYNDRRKLTIGLCNQVREKNCIKS